MTDDELIEHGHVVAGQRLLLQEALNRESTVMFEVPHSESGGTYAVYVGVRYCVEEAKRKYGKRMTDWELLDTFLVENDATIIKP